MARLITAVALSAFVLVGAANEASERHIDSAGKHWSARFNKRGAVLRSGQHTIHVMRDCSAVSTKFGKGRWEWANGGFLIVLASHEIGFPRQELGDDPPSHCRS